MFLDKDAPKEKIVAALAESVATIRAFTDFYQDWQFRKSVPLGVEEHLLRAGDEMQTALALMVGPPREETK